MYIKTFRIQKFKSFKDVTFHFNSELNILTGVNNSGKTTVLEAISLWIECFSKLIYKAVRSTNNYNKNEFVLGNADKRYFQFDEINSVRSPNSEDIYFERTRNRQNWVEISAILENEKETLEITFQISDSGGNYKIEIPNFTGYDFAKFNNFFSRLPDPFGFFYSSPISTIPQIENFATEPQIKEALTTRNSVSVIRNRIYKLYQTEKFSAFKNDLTYILYNTTDAPKLTFFNRSDIQRDIRVSINLVTKQDEIEKDLALLGSGSLQAIEILLNLHQYSDEKKDMNIILLDEPDSHIHRDIQSRLMVVLTRFSKNNQIFISTHNEALIRSSSYKTLFHLDGKAVSEIKNIESNEINKSGAPHFYGIFPSQTNPLIKSFGSTNGLDFINAIEADRLIFVEGEDDARVYSQLLKQFIGNENRKFMFWVLGGVSKIFDDINGYKLVFSQIKNTKSLWEKSFLIFDKDAMTDEHKEIVVGKFKEKLGLESFCFGSYTQESVLFTDLNVLHKLLCKWVEMKAKDLGVQMDIFDLLYSGYNEMGKKLSSMNLEDKYKEYRGRYVDKINGLFDPKHATIKLDDVKINNLIKDYYQQVNKSGEYYKLMTKDDVEYIIKKSVSPASLTFSIEADFVDLIKLADKSLWYKDWDFLSKI